MRIVLLLSVWFFALLPYQARAFPAQFGLSPDNNLDLLTNLIRSASRSLVINIYQFDNDTISAAIVDRIKANVTTEILIEGEPVGLISPGGKHTLSALRSAMDSSNNRGHRLYLMTSRGGASKNRRFRFNHAKYVIADGIRVLIGSENFTSGGHPRAGEIGNRGWEVVLENPELSRKLDSIFRADTSMTYGDVVEYSVNMKHSELPPELTKAARLTPAIPAGRGNVVSANLITSPDSITDIIHLIRSARSRIEIEKMSLPSKWRLPAERENPIVTEIVNAARRGVNVRVLLNDENAFLPQPPPNLTIIPTLGPATSDAWPESGERPRPNAITARLLKTYAYCLQVPLAARIVSTRAAEISYIHNKGLIVDDTRVLISSINGTQNSVENNREVAVLLESPDAGRYYGGAFNFDWDQSPDLPSTPISCEGLRN